ncbi:MAG: CapA family protein [Clostridia bacterium]|nr:CapA family protein [Clostridia bacterium]
MKFTAVGDVLCQKRMPDTYEGFETIRDYIMKGDARFFNLETTVNYEGECYGCQHSGGTYIRCNPEVAEDMLRYGFNMVNFNNNHIMDFAHEGMLKTMEYVNAMDIVNAGVGMNLHQASAPAYLETPNGRVAIISVSTSFAAPCMAGVQSRRIPGRPGINGIRVSRKVMVPEESFGWIQKIGVESHINDAKNITRAEGYHPALPEGVAEIGEMQFVKGETYDVVLTPNAKDMARVKESIEEALLQADYVMISIHAHQIEGKEKETVPRMLESVCRSFIDYGADAVVGHGPHLLRAIEVYKDKPIFYSLGDFLIQLYSVPVAPEDFYDKYGLTSDMSPIKLLEKRSAGFTRGLMEEDRMREAVVPYWETDENKKLTKLELLPVKATKGEKGHHLEGLPQPVEEYAFMEKLASLSAPYGVEIKMENGLGVCTWKKGE